MKNFIPAFIWALVVLALSAGPGINLPESWWDLLAVDKLGHLIVYGLLTVFALWGVYKNRKNTISLKSQWITVVLSSIYGILLEMMQFFFFPGRYFEILDIIANIIGSIIGLFLFRYFIIKNP